MLFKSLSEVWKHLPQPQIECNTWNKNKWSLYPVVIENYYVVASALQKTNKQNLRFSFIWYGIHLVKAEWKDLYSKTIWNRDFMP